MVFLESYTEITYNILTVLINIYVSFKQLVREVISALQHQLNQLEMRYHFSKKKKKNEGRAAFSYLISWALACSAWPTLYLLSAAHAKTVRWQLGYTALPSAVERSEVSGLTAGPSCLMSWPADRGSTGQMRETEDRILRRALAAQPREWRGHRGLVNISKEKWKLGIKRCFKI